MASLWANIGDLGAGVYVAAPAALTDGQRSPLRVGEYGALLVTPVDPTTGLPLSTTDPAQVYVSDSYLNVAAGTATTAVKVGAGTLVRIVINTKGASSNTLTVYDSLAGSGTKIATIDTTTAVVALEFGVAFGIGLTIVSATGTGADYTAVYR